jgi:hypothetical protein
MLDRRLGMRHEAAVETCAVCGRIRRLVERKRSPTPSMIFSFYSRRSQSF